MQHGPLIILSGPSGSGKSTVVRRLIDVSGLPLRQSVSATTRSPREGERDGVHYHFWDRGRFEAEVARGGFLEWADVYGNYYGTPRDFVAEWRQRGFGVVLVIDVQGAEQVRAKCPDAVSIFLQPPSLEELERRLRGRDSEDEGSFQRRLANARAEMARAGEYTYQVVNDTIENAVARVGGLLGPLFPRESHAG